MRAGLKPHAGSSSSSWAPGDSLEILLPRPLFPQPRVQLDVTDEVATMSLKRFHFGEMDPRLAYFKLQTSLSPLLVSLRLQVG